RLVEIEPPDDEMEQELHQARGESAYAGSRDSPRCLNDGSSVTCTLSKARHDTVCFDICEALVSGNSGGFQLSRAVGQGCEDPLPTSMSLHPRGSIEFITIYGML